MFWVLQEEDEGFGRGYAVVDGGRWTGGREGWEAADVSNDSWVKVEEMRLNKQEGFR